MRAGDESEGGSSQCDESEGGSAISGITGTTGPVRSARRIGRSRKPERKRRHRMAAMSDCPTATATMLIAILQSCLLCCESIHTKARVPAHERFGIYELDEEGNILFPNPSCYSHGQLHVKLGTMQTYGNRLNVMGSDERQKHQAFLTMHRDFESAPTSLGKDG